ncbi:Cache 3/Cache 2 fusion domain-containing protein [Vibrio sp. MA64]|uniref:Cache 3/Cache 2 fusion domain-containing protein n=1 Tax=Vibrio sp. MA64 TaxID=2896365 RepID=UPI001E4CA706|nr:Cache 3/Cache 2 fusion domain-containing protein [Vibrio sp. MA64]MCC9650230.1 Cache 3/Cache 2 fusion domain-containing protein [Vibrio sp. MA64]
MNTNNDRQIYGIHAVPRCVSYLEKCLNGAELFNNILLGNSQPELKINGVITKSSGATHQELASSDHFTSNSGALTIVSARTSDNEFIWLTTLFQKQGECASSTLLGRPCPSYRQLLSGSDFKSAVSLFGKTYLTVMSPDFRAWFSDR